MEGLVNFSPSPNFEVLDFYEYLLVVHPPEEVYDQIKKEKECFSSEFNVSVAKKTLPYITVANFLAREEMEGRLGSRSPLRGLSPRRGGRPPRSTGWLRCP